VWPQECPAGEKECTRAILDLSTIRLARRLRGGDPIGRIREHELADQHLIVEFYFLRREQLFERPVRRIAGACGTDLACIATQALASPAVAANGVLRLRRRSAFDAALFGP